MASPTADLWLDMIATSLAPELRVNPLATPGEMAAALDRSTIRRPQPSTLIDEHLVKVANGEIEWLIISMPPREGKSERASRRFRSSCCTATPICAS